MCTRRVVYNGVMPGVEIFSLVILAAIVWLWLDSLKAREIAVRAARAACAADELLLLDDTVAIANLKPVRDDDGHVKLQRAYNFEFSDTGDNRLKGSVVLLGHRVLMLNVGPGLPRNVHTLH
jgi:hypothetical protein